jgi:4-hydroxy-4-methyl-2-oxoglutarate aldolase
VVPRADAVAVVAASAAREEKEAVSRARYQGGELGLDLQEMRERLADKGLRYVDHPGENA